MYKYKLVVFGLTILKKGLIVSKLIVTLSCLCFAQSNLFAQPVSSEKILIVYLSRTQNTKAVAELIQKNTGGKLIAIELQKPYPEDYRATVQQVVEENERGFLPPLRTKIDSLSRYDIVFIGFPTWGMKMPPPMKSFLKSHDLRGKTIIPFNTNAGYGVGSGFDTVKELCKGSKILKGFVITGGIERDGILLAIKNEKAVEAEKSIKSWLKEINITREQ